MKVLLDPINLTTKSEQATFWIACLKTSWKRFYFNSAHQVWKKRKRKRKLVMVLLFLPELPVPFPFFPPRHRSICPAAAIFDGWGIYASALGKHSQCFLHKHRFPWQPNRKEGGKKWEAEDITFLLDLPPDSHLTHSLSLVSPPSSLFIHVALLPAGHMKF